MGACWMAPRSLRWPNRSRVRPCVCNFRLVMPAATADKTMEKLVSLAKRRGFVFQSSEIYGGLGSVWDYGPLGVELKKNIKERWWRSMVHERHDIEGLDAAILMHPKVWEASGHVAGLDRKSTRLNSSHGYISYAVFCLKKKKKTTYTTT